MVISLQTCNTTADAVLCISNTRLGTPACAAAAAGAVRCWRCPASWTDAADLAGMRPDRGGRGSRSWRLRRNGGAIGEHDGGPGAHHVAVTWGASPTWYRSSILGPSRRLKPRFERTDPGRWRGDLRDLALHAVGKTFAQAIERWELEHRGDAGLASERTIRPHLRPAHIATYTWTGAGREIPRVRFLLPISVKGDASGRRGRRHWFSLLAQPI